MFARKVKHFCECFAYYHHLMTVCVQDAKDAVEDLHRCCTFLRAKADSALARLSHRSFVCLSVCPSHRWMSQKRCKLGSPNFHHWLSGRL